MLHYFHFDFGASHDLMSKAVMEALEFNITKPFHDMYAFDSRAVKCIRVIKDLVVSVAQLPMKIILVDVVVVDTPPKYGMLLFGSCTMKIGGTLQMDYSNATIPVLGGETRR